MPGPGLMTGKHLVEGLCDFLGLFLIVSGQLLSSRSHLCLKRKRKEEGRKTLVGSRICLQSSSLSAVLYGFYL